ncbi:MAG: PAS domain-containing protein, partial [Myxococcota bacterium]
MKAAAGRSCANVWERAASFTWEVASGESQLDAACIELLGVRAESGPIQLDDCFRLVQPDDRAMLQAALDECARGQRSVSALQVRVQHPQQGWRCLAIMSSVLDRDEAGCPRRLLVLIADATERARETARFRRFVEHSADVIWTVDNQLRFTYVSPSVEQLRGVTPQEAMKESLADTMTPESLAFVLETHAGRVGDEPKPDEAITVEIEQTRRDGTTVWVEAVIQRLLDERGEHVGYIGRSRDISERWKAAEALAASERRYRELFDAARDVILLHEDL